MKDDNAMTSEFSADVVELYQPLRDRTREYAIRIIRLYRALPGGYDFQTIGKQLVRSGTSIGAHYREANRARSNAEFISKLEVGLQELDETRYWLEIIQELEMVTAKRLSLIIQETDELIAILTACVKRVKAQ